MTISRTMNKNHKLSITSIDWLFLYSSDRLNITTRFFYENVIFWLKLATKEIEIATNKMTTMFLILERFEASMFLYTRFL